MSLDRSFREWLEQLADELDWPVEKVARHIGSGEIENRLNEYPKLRVALSGADIEPLGVRSRASKCWALGHGQDEIRLSQFTATDGAMGAIRLLTDDFPADDPSAASRVDEFIEAAIELGYRHPENGGRFTASAALLASVVLTALHPERFVDFRHKRWEDLAVRLDSDHPASGSDEYGRRLLWAGSFAQEVSMTPTFQRFWSTGEPLWVVSGICWDAMTPHGMKRLREERSGDDDAEREYNEGKQRMRWHRDRERSQAVVNRAKSLRLKNDPLLRCDACGFSFVETYGDLGKEFVEAHHKVPLAKLEIGTKTKVEDLAMVCANCHRMLHRDDDTLSIEQLKVILTSLDPERPDI